MAIISLHARQIKKSVTNEDLFEQILYISNTLQNYMRNVEKSSVVYKKSFEEVNENQKLNEIIQRLKPHAQNIEICIDDLHNLIFELGAIMKICREVIDLIDEGDQQHKYLLRLCIIVHDLIKRVRAERFKAEEIALIKEALEKIIKQDVTRDEVIQIDKKMMERGLNWVIGG